MKKFLISSVVAVLALALGWVAFAQTEGVSNEKGRQEQREAIKKKLEQMPEGEKEKFRAEMREKFGERGFLGREEQLNVIKAIEEQIAKLKAVVEASPTPEERQKIRDLPEEEKAKAREKMVKSFGERQDAIRVIEEQVAKLRGPRPMGIGQEEAVQELKAIHELAIKENAQETASRLGKLIARYQPQMGSPIRPRPEGAGPGLKPPVPLPPPPPPVEEKKPPVEKPAEPNK